MTDSPGRRNFLKGAGAAAAVSTLPLSMVKLAFADPAQDFTFAYISDSHIQHITGNEFVRNWDRGLIRAVAETNLLRPKPDFVMFSKTNRTKHRTKPRIAEHHEVGFGRRRLVSATARTTWSQLRTNSLPLMCWMWSWR